MVLDFSRKGLEGLPVTTDFEVLGQRLNDVIDMTSPIGENISGSLTLEGTKRQVSISRLANQFHLYSVTLLSINGGDSFEGIDFTNANLPGLEKRLKIISSDFHLHDQTIVSASLKLSLNLCNEQVVGISWYHPSVEIG